MNTLAQIEALKQEVVQLSSQLAESEQHSRVARKLLRKAKLRALYLRFAQALRAPAKEYSLWFPGVLIVGSFLGAAIAFVLLFLLGLSATSLAIGTSLAAVAMLGFLTRAIISPATSTLATLIAEQQTIKAQLRQDLIQWEGESEDRRRRIETTKSTINELADSNRIEREQLLKENWKTMQGTEWQEFLVKVFEALGASAQMARTTGDEGVDLLVRFGEMMIAVQAKGFVGSVDKEAIQQVVAGKAHYGCDRAAVITNSRFSAPARSIALGHSCFLIGEQEFPAFVMGSNLEMFQ